MNTQHDHNHAGRGLLARVFRTHSHGPQTISLDAALATGRGIWALKVSLAGLTLTALFQVGVVALSGSVALLADTVHNFSDALTALPLWLAFRLARRAQPALHVRLHRTSSGRTTSPMKTRGDADYAIHTPGPHRT